jgi:hypothetical protein
MFPPLVIPGGGLNTTIAGSRHTLSTRLTSRREFRVIEADLTNAKGGQSSGPVEVDRPWDAYSDDHIGLMDPSPSSSRPLVRSLGRGGGTVVPGRYVRRWQSKSHSRHKG